MDDEIVSLRNCVKSEVSFSISPGKLLAVETVELGNRTANRPFSIRGLYIDFRLHIVAREEPSALVEEFFKGFSVGELALGTCLREVARDGPLLCWVFREIKVFARLSLTMAANFDREKQFTVKFRLVDTCGGNSGDCSSSKNFIHLFL